MAKTIDPSKELTPFSANPLIVCQPRLKRVLPNGDSIESPAEDSQRVWARIHNNRSMPRKERAFMQGPKLPDMENLIPYKPK